MFPNAEVSITVKILITAIDTSQIIGTDLSPPFQDKYGC
jgi:hypothetical protein